MTQAITNYHYWQYFLTLETDLITTSRYIEFTGADVNNKNNAGTLSTELLGRFFAACDECENIAKILAEKKSKKKSKDEISLSELREIIKNLRHIKCTDADVKKNNAETFSPELLRIFFAACAECENIAKILAKEKSEDRISLHKLRNIIITQNKKNYGRLPNRTISCPAYSLYFTPWKTWEKTNNNDPQWWIDYNHVKHGRETNYHKANLSNTLNSMAALLCLLFEYYKKKQDRDDENFIYYVASFPPALATKLFITDVSGLGFGNGTWDWWVKEEKEPNS